MVDVLKFLKFENGDEKTKNEMSKAYKFENVKQLIEQHQETQLIKVKSDYVNYGIYYLDPTVLIRNRIMEDLN